jgi:hypothetical protein
MTHYCPLIVVAFVALACGESDKHGAAAAGGGGVSSAGGTAALAGSSGAGSSSAGTTAGTSQAGSGGAVGGAGTATSGGASGAASGGGVGGVTDSEGTLGCAPWIGDQPSKRAATATFGPDGLVLAYPVGMASQGPKLGDFSLVQAGLSGDFDVTVGWNSFLPGDVKPFKGPKFKAGLFWSEPDGTIYSAIGNVGGGTTQATLIHGDQFTINSLSPVEAAAWYEGAAGSFRFQRSGSTVTVTSQVNGKSVTAISTEPFSEQPLELALWFDAETGTTPSTKPSGVTITGVQVAGGGGLVKPDDFSCP